MFTYIIGLLIVGVLIGIDQIVKQLIVHFMHTGDTFPIIKGFFSITSVRNTGAAWNMFNNQLWFFIIITFVALAIFGYFFTKADFKKKKLYSISTSMIIAGTLGNFIDRLFYPNHAVVDMFEFTFIDFPVFNIADCCLVIGIILFAVDIVFFTKEEKKDGQPNNQEN